MAKEEPPSRQQPRQPKPLPQCKAILLCERTKIEAGTGKVSLMGTFEQFEIPSFPGQSSPFELYLVLIDGIGRYDLVVEVHDLQDGAILLRGSPIKIEWPERLARLALIMPIAPIHFEHGGQYDIIVLGDCQEIDRQKVSAIERGGEHNAAQEDE